MDNAHIVMEANSMDKVYGCINVGFWWAKLRQILQYFAKFGVEFWVWGGVYAGLGVLVVYFVQRSVHTYGG
ncbi:MAG TPA: hypothetical protein PKH93_14690 [Chitinophagales bacterium]|nr:hypothetical protein [Chitinophagales bacterium]HNL08823.1 hypothetical protein [Chitinophagales bacterium]